MSQTEVTSRMDWRPVHAIVLIGLTAITAYVPAFCIWPLIWLMPLFGYAASVILVPPLRATFRRWRFGRVSTSTVVAAGVIAVGSCAVLAGFQFLSHPDLSAYRHFFPVSALGGIYAMGVMFSVFNALFEEIIFRGVLFDAIESQWGIPMAVIATALLFGYGHLHGYPPGLVGAVLAGIYGICLGLLRVFSGGLGLPVMAHIAADATIFVIIARSGVFYAEG